MRDWSCGTWWLFYRYSQLVRYYVLVEKSNSCALGHPLSRHYLLQWSSVISPIPPLGHIWDVMLVSRKGNIEKNCLYVTVSCTIIMVHKGTSSSYRSVDCIGLWSCLVYLSIFHVPLYLRCSWCYMYILTFVCLHQWAEPGGIGSWPGWLTIVFHCCYIVGWVTWSIKSSPKWPKMCRMVC